MTQQTLQRLSFLMVLSISVVLTACGGAGGEAPKPGNHTLEIVGQLKAGEFNPGALLRAVVITGISPDLESISKWYEPSFAVAGDGRYSISIDSRKIVGQGVDPKLFGKWHLQPGADEVMDISASDGNASLRVLSDSIRLYQGGSTTPSHRLKYRVTEEVEGKPRAMWGRPVFSDRDVRIQGTVGAAAATPRRRVDMSLKAGWNLVYIQFGSRDTETLEFVARAMRADDQPELVVEP